MYDGPSSYPVHAPSNDASLGSPDIQLRSAKGMQIDAVTKSNEKSSALDMRLQRNIS